MSEHDQHIIMRDIHRHYSRASARASRTHTPPDHDGPTIDLSAEEVTVHRQRRIGYEDDDTSPGTW